MLPQEGGQVNKRPCPDCHKWHAQQTTPWLSCLRPPLPPKRLLKAGATLLISPAGVALAGARRVRDFRTQAKA